MLEMKEHERIRLTRYIMGLLEAWAVPPADRVGILGLPDGTRSRTLRRYFDDTPFPEDPRVDEHVSHLYAIGQALQTTYPRNEHMGKRWMQKRNRHLRNRTPLSVMTDDGTGGLRAVRAQLDCTYAWDLTGSRP